MPAILSGSTSILKWAANRQVGAPALVLSPRIYNEKRMVCVACPITSRVRGYPFEVELPSGCGVSGVVLSDQIKCLPWTERRASPAGKAAAATLDQVKARLRALLNL